MHVRVTVCMCVCFLYVCFACCNSICFWEARLTKILSLPFRFTTLFLSLSRLQVVLCMCLCLSCCCLVLFHTTYANILADAGAPALNWNGAAFGVDCKRYWWVFVFKVFFWQFWSINLHKKFFAAPILLAFRCGGWWLICNARVCVWVVNEWELREFYMGMQ